VKKSSVLFLCSKTTTTLLSNVEIVNVYLIS